MVLRRIRLSKGRTQREVARTIEMDFAYFSRLESDTFARLPTRATIEKIANAMQCTATEKAELLAAAGRVSEEMQTHPGCGGFSERRPNCRPRPWKSWCSKRKSGSSSSDQHPVNGGKEMTQHKIPDLLRHVQGLSLPISPPPSRFWRHADVIDPIAESYAALYYLAMASPCRWKPWNVFSNVT